MRIELLVPLPVPNPTPPPSSPFLGDRFLSSAGTGENFALPMRLPDHSPVLDKNCALMGPEILSSTRARVCRRAPMAFPDSSSVLDKFQSATFPSPLIFHRKPPVTPLNPTSNLSPRETNGNCNPFAKTTPSKKLPLSSATNTSSRPLNPEFQPQFGAPGLRRANHSRKQSLSWLNRVGHTI